MKLCEWFAISYAIINYAVRMDFQSKSFIEPGEICTHWLKITFMEGVRSSNPEI